MDALVLFNVVCYAFRYYVFVAKNLAEESTKSRALRGGSLFHDVGFWFLGKHTSELGLGSMQMITLIKTYKHIKTNDLYSNNAKAPLFIENFYCFFKKKYYEI